MSVATTPQTAADMLLADTSADGFPIRSLISRALDETVSLREPAERERREELERFSAAAAILLRNFFSRRLQLDIALDLIDTSHTVTQDQQPSDAIYTAGYVSGNATLWQQIAGADLKRRLYDINNDTRTSFAAVNVSVDCPDCGTELFIGSFGSLLSLGQILESPAPVCRSCHPVPAPCEDE